MDNKRAIFLVSGLFCMAVTAAAQNISFTRSELNVSSGFAPVVIADIDGNGWLEPLGTLNDGAGNLLPFQASVMGLGDLFLTASPTDARVADFDGDGCPDLIAERYSSTNIDTRALLYFNDGTGRFNKNQTFADLNIRGRGEGVVVADFNNDGYVDIFLPYYTLSCSGSDQGDPLCPNAPQAYLFLNDGHGHFREVAKQAGLDFSPCPSSGCPPGSNPPAPNGMQPEGVEAADVNSDGLIDLYVGGRLMLNTGVDVKGIPQFKDLCTLNPSCGIPPPPSNGTRGDEGFKFVDWNNDGLLDLVIHDWRFGPTLYENKGTAKNPFFIARTITTDGASHPLFSTGAPSYQKALFQDSFGMNIYDMDGDGLEDIVTAATFKGDTNPCLNPPNSTNSPCAYPNIVFRNTGYGFEQVSAGDGSGMFGGGQVAFADINRDGKIDMICSGCANGYYLINNSPNSPIPPLSIEMFGPNGEKNQQGRVVTINPLNPDGSPSNVIYTRVVDGGSGYHAQNQYGLLIGTPLARSHSIKAFYATSSTCDSTTAVTFTMNPGQYAQVFSPSVQYPCGRFVLYNQPPPPAPLRCVDWLRPALDLLAN